MKTSFQALRWISVAASVLWAAAHTCSAASSHLIALTPSSYGTYGTCGNNTAAFRVGQAPESASCLERSYLSFFVSEITPTIVGADLFIPVTEVYAPAGKLMVDFHDVTTSYVSLINYFEPLQTYQDLGDGPLLGSLELPALIPQLQDYNPFVYARVKLNQDAIAQLNRMRGKQFLLGASSSETSSLPPNIARQQRLIGDNFTRFRLVLQTTNAIAPEVRMVTPNSQLLSGAPFFVAASVAGQEPIEAQWLKDGVPLPGETNTTLFISGVTTSDSGRYELRASNPFGTNVGIAVTLTASPVKIVSQPTASTIPEGTFGCLAVRAIGYGALDYRWRKDGIPISNNGDFLNTPQLCFASARLTDAGKYDVVVTSSFGSVTSAAVALRVPLRPPSIDFFPSGLLLLAAGTTASLSANVSGSDPLTLQWLKDGQPLPGAIGTQINFAPLQLLDSGNYQLRISNTVGKVTSPEAQLRVQPALLNSETTVNAAVGAPLTLWSQLTAVPETSVQWYFNGQLLEGETSPFLSKISPKDSDAGDYFLVASNSFGVVTGGVFHVATTTLPPSANILSQFSSPIPVGNPLVLFASVSGAPPPSIQWFRDNDLLVGETNFTLVIRSAKPSDQGVYSVQGSNSVGIGTGAISISVTTQPPSFISFPGTGDVSVVEGNALAIPTRAIAGPPAQYQWRRNGTELPGETNSTLRIPTSQTTDAGFYQVVATNPSGVATNSFMVEVVAKSALDGWDWSTPHPQGSRLKDIAKGSDRWVAVGKAGNIVTSTDGIHWSNILINVNCDLRQVAYGNGVFLAAGSAASPVTPPTWPTYGQLFISTNGLEWTSVASPQMLTLGLCFGNGRFLLAGVGDPGNPFSLLTSTNGIDWSGVGVTPYGLNWIDFIEGQFWLATPSELQRSIDGEHWKPVTRSLLGESMGQLAYGDGRYIVVGYGYQGTQISLDGTHWKAFTHTTDQVQSLAFGNHRFVGAVRDVAGIVTTSEDGIHWTSRNTGTRQELEKIIFVDGRFWAVGEAGTILNSTNGVDWSKSITDTEVDYYGLTTFQDNAVAVGDNGTVLTSLNGESWLPQATPSGRNLHTVHQGGGRLVAGGRGGRIMTSEDSVSWASRPSGTSNYVERLAWADGWVAACEGGDILTSRDGLTWSSTRTVPASDHEGVAYGNRLWAVAGGYFGFRGANSTLFVSTNRTDWRLIQTDFGVRLRDITFGNGLFVAVGNDGLVAVFIPSYGSTNPLQLGPYYHLNTKSPDGSQVANFRRVIFSYGRFIAVGNNGVLFSSTNPSDPGSWVEHYTHTSQNLHDILARPDGTFIAVGNNGMILHSGESQPYFEGIRVQGGEAVLAFVLPKRPGPFQLEGSTDMVSWRVISNAPTSPARIPIEEQSPRYFRITAP